MIEVSAGGVVVNPDGNILVVNQNHNSWSLPKGHHEEGESYEETARREILEESGVSRLRLVKELGSYTRYRIGQSGMGEDRTKGKTLHFFLFRTDQMELMPQDPHNPEARWVAKGDVEGYLTHPKDKEFFRGVVGQL